MQPSRNVSDTNPVSSMSPQNNKQHPYTNLTTSPTTGASATHTLSNLTQNIDLKYLNPARIDWGKLKVTVMKGMSSPYIIFIIIACAISVFMLGFAIYKMVKWYQTNQNDYPVLLTLPVRGALYTHDPSTMGSTIYYVLDREGVNYDGLQLPYAGNEISFLQEPKLLPELNHGVQFTVNFWMNIENYGQLALTNKDSYTVLLAHNYNGVGQFQICYDTNNNTIVILVETKTTHGKQSTETYSIPDVLLVQRWQMITVVLDNRDLDVYYNKNLTRSFHLENVPYLGVANDWCLYPGKNEFMGLVSCVRYFDYAFNMNEVYRLHRWQEGEEPPKTSYYFWWTWYKGNSVSSVYNSLVKDTDDFVKYSTYGLYS